MSTMQWKTLPTSFTSAISLGTLANNANSSASSSIDASSTKELVMALQLNLATQGSARSAGALFSVFLLPSIDNGTTFVRLSEATAECLWNQQLDAATTAGIYVMRDIPVWAQKFELFARNSTGQALAGTNTLSYCLYTLESV